MGPNEHATAASEVSRAAFGWCETYIELALGLPQLFLYLALFVALIETWLLVWGKLKALIARPVIGAFDPQKELVASINPVKLIEALKGLLETLKGLPAWIAIFLAGLALLWIANERPKWCPAIAQGQTVPPTK